MRIVKKQEQFYNHDKHDKHDKIEIIIPVLVSINFVLIFLTWFYGNSIVQYNLDNYRYIYSALLQVVGSIFAFIASSTLVVLQLLHSNAPNSARFFPEKIFSSFLIISLLVLVCDTVAILSLNSEVTFLKQFIFNWLIIINIYPIFFAFIYTLYVIRYLSPKNQVEQIIRLAKKAKSNNERSIIIYSLEEMFLSAIKSGQGGNVRLYQNTLTDIISIFTDVHVDLNVKSKYKPDHPLRIIPDIIERITSSMIDNDMSNLLHFNGHILRQLSGSKYNGEDIVNVEIACSIGHITKECMDNTRLVDLNNFCANFIMGADEKDGLDTIFWGVRNLVEQLSNHPSKENVSYIFSAIVMDLQYLFDNVNVKNTSGVEQLVSFLENQKILIKICAERGNNNVFQGISDIRRSITKE
ncbi:MAG: hypothetical protein ACERKN_17415 [Velocimicrobium sp.]